MINMIDIRNFEGWKYFDKWTHLIFSFGISYNQNKDYLQNSDHRAAAWSCWIDSEPLLKMRNHSRIIFIQENIKCPVPESAHFCGHVYQCTVHCAVSTDHSPSSV